MLAWLVMVHEVGDVGKEAYRQMLRISRMNILVMAIIMNNFNQIFVDIRSQPKVVKPLREPVSQVAGMDMSQRVGLKRSESKFLLFIVFTWERNMFGLLIFYFVLMHSLLEIKKTTTHSVFLIL